MAVRSGLFRFLEFDPAAELRDVFHDGELLRLIGLVALRLEPVIGFLLVFGYHPDPGAGAFFGHGDSLGCLWGR